MKRQFKVTIDDNGESRWLCDEEMLRGRIEAQVRGVAAGRIEGPVPHVEVETVQPVPESHSGR
jgi:hypothetical protein